MNSEFSPRTLELFLVYDTQKIPTVSGLYTINYTSVQRRHKAIQHTTKNRVLIRPVRALLVSIAQEVWAGAVAILALELS